MHPEIIGKALASGKVVWSDAISEVSQSVPKVFGIIVVVNTSLAYTKNTEASQNSEGPNVKWLQIQ